MNYKKIAKINMVAYLIFGIFFLMIAIIPYKETLINPAVYPLIICLFFSLVNYILINLCNKHLNKTNNIPLIYKVLIIILMIFIVIPAIINAEGIIEWINELKNKK